MAQESDNLERREQRVALVPTGVSSWMLHTFRSLQSYNYRVYATSQLISSCGSWIQLTAISWLVFDITNSAFHLGLISFLRQSPLLILGYAGGWLADHVERKKILITTKILMLLQAVFLSWLTITGNITIWHMLILALCLGIANAIDIPAKQSLTFQLVDRKDLVNAVSLNTSSFHASRTIGPVLAVGVVSLLGNRVGEATCFALNALSFIFVIYALSKIQPNTSSGEGSKETGKKEIGFKKVIDFVFKTPAVRKVLILGAVSSLLCMQYIVMLPVIAKTILERAIDGYGLLLACAASGSFMAAIHLANKGKEGKQLEDLVSIAAVGFGVALILFSLSSHIILSCALAVALGFFSTSQLSGSNSLVQLLVDDELRGRVLSMWVMVISGLGPIGGLLVGFAATKFGAGPTLAVCGICATIISLSIIFLGPKSPKKNVSKTA